MKKAIKRIATGTLFGLITLISGVVTLILYPQPLFANKLEYKSFNVYSNNKINTDIKVVLDSAYTLVSKSELHDPTFAFDIFLAYNSLYNRFDDALLEKGPAARAIDNNVIIKVRIDPKSNRAYPTFHENCEVEFTYLLAHEMVHCLQANRYGKMKFNPFRHPEMWKLEGYPEYVSRQLNKSTGYMLANEIDSFVNRERKSKDGWIAEENGNCFVPKIYSKSRLMMKYLTDVKHFSYARILNDTTSEHAIYAEMIEWKDQHKRINN